MEKHFDPDSEPEKILNLSKEEIANLPLEDYVTLLGLLQPSSPDERGLIDEKKAEIRKILYDRINSFPMNEETIRVLFQTAFLSQGALFARVDELEIKLIQLQESLLNGLEFLERNYNYPLG